MKTEVRLATQVSQFIRAKAPAPRRRLTQAVKQLQKNRGDLKMLEGRLSGSGHLRVGAFRIIFRENFHGGCRQIDCIFAEHRGVVYEVFERVLESHLGGK